MNPEFIETIRNLTGSEDLIKTLTSTGPEISIRLNPAKPGYYPDGNTGRVPWFGNGIYLTERPKFTLIPQLHSGAFYVQDASSMFTAAVLKQIAESLDGTPLCYLDACAAPGGKTTAAIDVLPPESLVVANEFDPKRCTALVENIVRWGYPFTVVTRGDAARFGKCGEIFDIIASDLPCSGEGMMRKEPEAVRQWSEGLVRDCAEKQYEIVAGLLPALKPGGFLIYSTCTFNTLENERNVSRLMCDFDLEPVPISPELFSEGIMKGEKVDGTILPESCARFYPGKIRGEGQFVALLRKPGELKPELCRDSGKSKSGKNRDKAKRVPFAAEKLILDPEKYAEVSENIIFPLRWMRHLKTIEDALTVVRRGFPVGTVKGKDFIPSHDLALSAILRQDAFPRVELPHEEALDYLRGNAPRLPEGTPKGIVLLTHSSLPIGFAKNIGNRANSLLPERHRIHNL